MRRHGRAWLPVARGSVEESGFLLPTPRLAGLAQGCLSPGAPGGSLAALGVGLAPTLRGRLGEEEGGEVFGPALRFGSPARVRSSIVASGASFLTERIPAMADALAAYASEVAIT